jgi:hypothetical protein
MGKAHYKTKGGRLTIVQVLKGGVMPEPTRPKRMDTGEPDAVKVASPVRGGAVGKGADWWQHRTATSLAAYSTTYLATKVKGETSMFGKARCSETTKQ